MDDRVLRASLASAIPAAALAWSSPALAQDHSETTSTGEIYDYQYVDTYGEGTTTYVVNVMGLVNGADAGFYETWSDYYDPVASPTGQAGLAQFVDQQIPTNGTYDVDGVPVQVIDWNRPALEYDGEDVVDYFYYVSDTTDFYTTTTTQTTSGDRPGSEIPIGYRGNCSDDGVSGATNFAPFDGAFPTCGDVEEFYHVAPGTINVNTHTNYYNIFIETTFSSFDLAEDYTLLLTPRHSLSNSSGTLDTTTLTFVLHRNDAYQVAFTGRLGGATIFTQTVPGRITDPTVKAALADLSRPMPYAVQGAPVVLLWSAPVLTGSSSDLVSSATDVTTRTTNDILTMVTTTEGGIQGAVVYIGDRGACTDAGLSGTTNGPSADGAQATCEGGVAYNLAPGETNTNTQTTYLTLTNKVTTLTENWLNTANWQLTAVPVPVGMIHAAVRGPLYRDAAEFSRRHMNSLGSNGHRFGLWAEVVSGLTKLDEDGAGPGNHDMTRSIAGGLLFAATENVRAGVAVQHDASRLSLVDFPESATVRLTQLGTAAEFAPGSWLIRVAAARGWADIGTSRRNPTLARRASADYHASTWSFSADAGPELGHGTMRLRPVAGIDWTSARLGSFAESGDIALRGPRDTASRSTVSAGLDGNVRMDVGNGASLRLWADGRVDRVLDGSARTRRLSFTGPPNELLRVSTASEPRTFGELRAGLAVESATGLRFQVGGETLVGNRVSGWRGSAGMSAAF